MTAIQGGGCGPPQARLPIVTFTKGLEAALRLVGERRRRVTVVDGLFVSRRELAELVDVAVLVTAAPEVRRARQRERADAPVGWLDRWDAAERWYFEHVRPPWSFDIIVA